MSAFSSPSFTTPLANAVLTTTALLAALLLGACKSETTLVVDQIPDAESQFFTDDGRLFVSGGDSVFEIVQRADGRYDKLDTFHEDCIVEGITHVGNYMYAVCTIAALPAFGEAYLLAGEITATIPSESDIGASQVHPYITLQRIGTLDKLSIPNGLEADSEGNLYVSYFATGDIARIRLAAPMQVDRVETWSTQKITLVNGLEWVGDDLYFTGFKDTGITAIFGRIHKNDDGTAGSPQILFERKNTVLDDITYYNGGLLITDYLNGSIVFWQEHEPVQETAQQIFFAPTSIAIGRPPLFDDNLLLVTEKGVILKVDTNGGDRLSQLPSPFF